MNIRALTAILILVSACPDDPDPPPDGGRDAGRDAAADSGDQDTGTDDTGAEDTGTMEEPFALVFRTIPTAHGGETHGLALRGADQAPAPGYAVERSCGMGPFVSVNLVLDADRPAALVAAPSITLPDPALTISSVGAALSELYLQLLEYAPFIECRTIPDCAVQLDSVLAAAEPEEELLTFLLARYEPLIPPGSVFVTGCVYRGVPIGGGAPVMFERLGAATRRYPDWTATIMDMNDPCFNLTPVECYNRRVERWKRRVCGEENPNGTPVNPPPPVDTLAQPFRDICRGIKDGSIEFAPPSCDPLGVKLAPTSSTATTATATTAVVLGKTTAGTGTTAGGGRTSTIAFDAETFLAGACSYGTFVHEAEHAAFFGRFPGWAMLDRAEARARAAAAAYVMAYENLMMLVDGGTATADQLTMAIDALNAAQMEFDAANTDFMRQVLEFTFATECSSYLAEMCHLNDLAEGVPLPGGDPVQQILDMILWKKSVVVSFLGQMSGILDQYPAGTLTTTTAACDCVNQMQMKATMTSPFPLPDDVWMCVSGLGPAGMTPADQYNDLRMRLGCR